MLQYTLQMFMSLLIEGFCSPVSAWVFILLSALSVPLFSKFTFRREDMRDKIYFCDKSSGSVTITR